MPRSNRGAFASLDPTNGANLMNRLVPAFVITVFVTFAHAAPAGAQRSARAVDRARQELLRNEDGWASALVKRDVAYFRRMLAAGFVYTEDDKVMTSGDVLRSAASPNDTVTAAHNEGMVVHLFGRETGVVTGLLIVQGRSDGKAYVHRYRFTDTWVEQSGGRWQIVAAQDYLIPAQKR